MVKELRSRSCSPRSLPASTVLALLGVVACVSGPGPEPADLVILHGKVYPGGGAPIAEGVAVRGSEILAVGTDSEIEKHRTESTTVLDARGGTVLAGFNDSHVHFLSGGESLDRVDLFDAETVEEAQRAIREFAAARPDAPWILGRGWLYGTFPGSLPTKEQLDQAVPDRPALMECYDGHSVWINSRALALAGVTGETPDPPNGLIVRDFKGEPTGVLKESAQELMNEVLPAPTREEKLELIKKGVRHALSLGVTSVQNAGMSPDEFALYAELERRGELLVRMYAALGAPPGFSEEEAARYEELLKEHPDTPFLRTGAIKMYADGVIESRTAALLEPYANADSTGNPNYSVEDMNRIVEMMDKKGWQIFIHAIGDGGIRMALDAYEQAAEVNPAPARGRRHRIEHIEAVSVDDIPRFAKLGVIASMQPFHANPIPNVLEVWAVNLGPERASRAWAWKSIQDKGGRLAFGTDWPVVDIDPRPGIHTALTRRTLEGKPEGGFVPGERLPLEDVLDAWTAGSAYASFEEERKGTLGPGMVADIVILSKDLFALPVEEVRNFEVVTTLVDGKVVYSRDAGTGGQP
ncbi:MAG TPA: amidohydrolase [Vicinamibacteria bacterium]|nr:amidohydrolase [Vicinamibacteria bacterium]